MSNKVRASHILFYTEKEALELIQKALQNPQTSTGSRARLNALKGE